MATLEELATQWEDALSTSTGTTIAPGTVTPKGITASGKKQLSWPEVVKKIQENTAFKSSEYLPTQLAGVQNKDIYKAGAKSGMLPAGLATFTKNPFSSFASRTAPNPYKPKSSSTQAASVAAQTQLTPVRGNVQQQPEDFWTQGDIDHAALDAYSPSTHPGDIKFIPSISGMLGQIGSAIMDNLSGKTQSYNDLTMATSEQMEHLYNQGEFGDTTTKEGRAKADGVVEAWRNGAMIWDGNYTTQHIDTSTGFILSDYERAYADDIYDYEDQPDGPIASAFNEYFADPLRKLLGDDIFMGNEEKYAGRTGYQKEGTYVDEFGNVSAGSSWDEFVQFTKDNPEQAAKYAEARGKGWFGLDAGLHAEAIRAGASAKAHRLDAGRKREAEEMGRDANERAAAAENMRYNQYIDNTTPYNYDPTGGSGGINTGGGDYNTYNDLVNLTNTTPTGHTLEITPTHTIISGPSSDAYDETGGGSDHTDDGFGQPGVWGSGDQGDEEFASGGTVNMANGGEAPQMPQPQQAQPQPQGVQGDIENLGMINEQAAAMPQNGGQQSVKDDIPREADEGDYILPYETVLLTGLNQLNRYAREAVKLAMENDINLKGTDIDPTDDVPIKVSNYEFHIPKMLVPFFGGGKKYLDKIRDEGLALRKRLEEEKQPSMQEQQPMNQEAAPAPQPQPQQMAEQAPQQVPAPQMPMMQEGGFVEDPVKAIKSAEQALTSDTSQPTQSAYNQVQAIERARVQRQQPPMVDPTGKVVQQGFAAPQGYKDGNEVSKKEYSDADLKFHKDMFSQLPDARALALLTKSEVKDKKEYSDEQAHSFMNMVMNRVSNGSFGGKDLKSVMLKSRQFAGINFEQDENHRRNFIRAITDTKGTDEDFLKYEKMAQTAINRKLPDITNGSLYVLNKKAYAKENNLPEGSLPDYLVDAMETKQVGDLTYYNLGPKPKIKPEKPAPPNLPALEKAYNKGGFIEAAA
tara:strand:- start:532 stop:3447 length:2916 start_codon:yes stop_codon:yes gene_type:complete